MNTASDISSTNPPYHQSQINYFSNRPLLATPTSEVAQHQTSAQAGLGLLPLEVVQSAQQSPLLTSSPSDSSVWSQTSSEQQTFSAPASSETDMYAPSFSAYSNYTAQHSQPQRHQSSSITSPEAPSLEYCQSATSSDLPSHRSSVCSYTSEAAEMNMAAARPKADEHHGWYSAPNNDHILQRTMASPGQIHFAHDHGMIPSNTHDLYRNTGPSAAEWGTPEGKGFVTELHATNNARLPEYDMHPVLPSVGRVNKKKRQRTRPDEATHECRECGKLFKRSYNWKSHMETHNPHRKYPHPCTALVGTQQCSKKFQRKTDLDRHYDSVHLKVRNHKCPLCGNRFARRDTLRRHTEDGCPKRFELGLRDTAAAQVQQQQPSPQQSQVQRQLQQGPSMTQLHQPQPQQVRSYFHSQVSMAPPMMQSHLPTGGPFSAYGIPATTLSYQA